MEILHNQLFKSSPHHHSVTIAIFIIHWLLHCCRQVSNNRKNTLAMINRNLLIFRQCDGPLIYWQQQQQQHKTKTMTMTTTTKENIKLMINHSLFIFRQCDGLLIYWQQQQQPKTMTMTMTTTAKENTITAC